MCTGATGNTDVCTHSMLSRPAGTRAPTRRSLGWAGKRQRTPTHSSRSRRQPHRPAPTYTPPPVSAGARTCAPRSNSWQCRHSRDAPGHRGGVPTTAAAMHAISSGPNARTHAATHIPRRRRPSRHHSQRRAPVPPAPATAPTPAPSQRETPVRSNAAGLALAPHVSDLPAPSAAPSCAGRQAYQHARACACTPAAQRQGTPAQRTRAELSKTRPAHPRGECAPGRQYRRMAWPGGEAVV